MKMVLNHAWSGFGLHQDFCDAYNLGDAWDVGDEIERDDPRLVKWVEDHADYTGKCDGLVVVEIPDSCTDWEMSYYGDSSIESIIYVVDGKIHHA